MPNLVGESEKNRLFEEIRELCLSFPGSNERISHGAPTFFIDNKHSFAQYRVNHHGDGRVAIWCSAPSGIQSTLIEASPDIFFRPPYMGHLGWIGLRLDLNVKWEEISNVLWEAYLNRAPKKYLKLI
jgi:hypothetical protein